MSRFTHILLLCLVFGLLGVIPALAQDSLTIDFYYPTAVDAAINDIIQGYADQFHELHPEITINAVYTGSYVQTRDTINTEIQGGGTGPDVAVMLTTDLYSFVEEGYVIPAQAFIDTMEDADAYVADFFPALMLNSTDEEGTIWSVPFQRSTPILIYNKDMFVEAGLDPEHAPMNLEELTADALALNQPENNRWGLMLPVQGGFPIWIFQSFAIAYGQNLNEGDPAVVYLNSPEILQALTTIVELGTVHNVMPAGGSVFGDTPTAFLDGQAAMIYHTTGALTGILNNATFDVGVGFLPSGPAGEDGTGYGTPTGGGNLYVFANSTPEEQAAAWEWIQFLSSPEIQSDWGAATGYIASRQSSWELDPLAARVAEFPQYAVARDQLAIADREFTSYRAIDTQNIINTTLSSIISGSVPLDQAQATLDEAQAQIDSLLAEYQE
jgi:sn-glycerol 3-phosphate transport system substrate-binding protein